MHCNRLVLSSDLLLRIESTQRLTTILSKRFKGDDKKKKDDKSNVKCEQPAKPTPTDVPGLSNKVLKVKDDVGPGASKSGDYKNPEYYSFHGMSFYEANIELLKYRLPQPSSRKSGGGCK